MPKNIKRQYTGGISDESLSEPTREKIRGLGGPSELEARIARELGRYRGNAQFRNTEPSAWKTIDHIDKTVGLIEKLKTNIELMPEVVNVLVWERLYRAEKESNIGIELDFCLALYRGIAEDLKSSESSKGEKPKTLERGLLSDVAKMIEGIPGIGVQRAADYAAEILISERVPYISSSNPKRKGGARSVVLAYRNSSTPKDNP